MTEEEQMTEEELEDAFIDWYFLDESGIDEELRHKGYKWTFFGESIESIPEFGDHALVTDEFPPGDLLYTKKLISPRLWRELGLTPISHSTKKEAKVQAVVAAFDDDETIEMLYEREGELHGDRTHWNQAAVIHPCARPGCEWQGSVLDEFGPVYHVESDTREGAVRLLFEDIQDWKPHRGAVDEVFTQIEKFQYPLHNPPFSGWRNDWWLEKMPNDVTKIAYRRKRDALNVFMDWNGPIIDLAFNGPSQEHPPASFDNFNARYNLKGKRKITNFAKALWFALPPGGPYYLEDIDVDMLNETQPMIHNAPDQTLRIPDYAEERRLVDQEAAYWAEKYGDIFPEEDDTEVPF